ncbi:hypothetical protein DNK63_11365 [Providencia rettgeri]|nr:hypothetical protein DNK63_11365 [Providencia rettgeri]
MNYYVHTSKDAQGDYEVHREGCNHMPTILNRKLLGDFYTCAAAVQMARSLGYVPANGCYWCSKECHTS